MLINSFTGEYGFLSNFYYHTVLPNSWAPNGYQSNEHGFNANKTIIKEAHDWVMSAPTPGEAKRRGQQVPLRDGWHQHLRYFVMEALIVSKFEHADLQIKLLGTHDTFLVEGNNWHDNVWGDCLCDRESCRAPGMNLLGSMLMTRRGFLGS
jgi:ribA/ribD-fused uncharacterized protein